MPSARQTIGPHMAQPLRMRNAPTGIVQFVPRTEPDRTHAIHAVIRRTEQRLRALTASYESECSRIRNEMLVQIKNIEAGGE